MNMATQTILIDLAETGLHLTAQVDVVGGSSFASSVDVAESGSLAGRYSFTLTDSAGQYRIELSDDDDSGALLAVLFAETTNTAASFVAVDQLTLLDIASDAAAAGSGGGGGSVQVAGLSTAAISQIAGTTIRLAASNQVDNTPLKIVRGCDYSEDDGTAFTWTVNDANDLTDATATLTLKKGTTSTTFTGTVNETSTDVWQILIELTAAETEALAASTNDWSYSLVLNLANGHTRSIRDPGHRALVVSAT